MLPTSLNMDTHGPYRDLSPAVERIKAVMMVMKIIFLTLRCIHIRIWVFCVSFFFLSVRYLLNKIGEDFFKIFQQKKSFLMKIKRIAHLI